MTVKLRFSDEKVSHGKLLGSWLLIFIEYKIPFIKEFSEKENSFYELIVRYCLENPLLMAEKWSTVLSLKVCVTPISSGALTVSAEFLAKISTV